MKAMVLDAPGPIATTALREAELPLPVPGPGQVRIRVEACGVCHTDLHTIEGDVPLVVRPLIPGHQVIGTVDALGEGVTVVALGQRVGVPWLHWTCGECAHCRNGRENLCVKALFTGLSVSGGYAEFLIAPGDFVHPIPPALDPVSAAPLLCAGVIGLRSLRLSDVRPGESLGLYGFGGSAHIVIQIAHLWNVRTFVFTRGDGHRRLAASLGASWTGRSDEAPPEPLDRAILFAPAGALVPIALRALRKGGTLAIASIYMDGIPALDYEQCLYGERTLRSVTASTRQDARDVLAIAAQGGIRTHVERVPLVRANDALRRLAARTIDGAAVLVPGTDSTGSTPQHRK